MAKETYLYGKGDIYLALLLAQACHLRWHAAAINTQQVLEQLINLCLGVGATGN